MATYAPELDSTATKKEGVEDYNNASNIEEYSDPIDSKHQPLSDKPTATPEECKRVLRKIDWRMLPLMCCCYGIQFVSFTRLSYT